MNFPPAGLDRRSLRGHGHGVGHVGLVDRDGGVFLLGDLVDLVLLAEDAVAPPLGAGAEAEEEEDADPAEAEDEDAVGVAEIALWVVQVRHRGEDPEEEHGQRQDDDAPCL